MKVESATRGTPGYKLISDDNYFKIVSTVPPEGSGATASKTECESVSRGDLLKHWKDAGPPFQAFYLSCLVITVGETHQRKSLTRIMTPNTRNLKPGVETTRRYLKEAMNMKKSLTMKALDKILSDAFATAKQELGFPIKDPGEYSYKITDDVVTAAASEPCIRYLETLKPREVIFPDEFKRITQTLKEEHGSDADEVIAAIRKTKTRDHIAAISISSEDDQTFLSVVDIHRHHIRMESWKFLALIERARETLCLHEYVKQRYGASSSSSAFVFNNNKSGRVVGKFNPEDSCLHVACLQEENDEVQDQARFILDSTYTLCVYTTLKRLRDDKERFARLREQSQMLAADRDPFEMIYEPSKIKED